MTKQKNILIIDAYNMWIRLFFPNKDSGAVDPSMTGCLYFLSLVYRNIKDFDEIFFVLDTDKVNHESTKIFEEYKQGRESKKELFKNFDDFIALISILPKLTIVRNPRREADLLIAFLAIKYGRDKNSNVIVYSNDKDFLQLTALSENIKVAQNYKDGKFLTLSEGEILNKFTDSKKVRLTEDIKEVIKWRTFLGDASDMIPSAIKGLQKTKIREIINLWKEDYLTDKLLGDMIIELSKTDKALQMRVVENFENITRNYKLMNLSKADQEIVLQKYTKKVNVKLSKEQYVELLNKYKVEQFKSFLGRNNLI